MLMSIPTKNPTMVGENLRIHGWGKFEDLRPEMLLKEQLRLIIYACQDNKSSIPDI